MIKTNASRDVICPRTAAYSLSASAYCREFNDGAIILDLHSGNYLGIDAENLPALRANVRNWPIDSTVRELNPTPNHSASSKLIAELISRKILTTSPVDEGDSNDIECISALPHFDNAGHRFRVPAMDITLFVISYSLVKWCIRGNRFPYLVSQIRRRQTRICKTQPTAMKELARIVSSFLRLRPWLYSADQHCFLDSLVLSVFLTLRSIKCSFVIGVTTKPFLAHAWVQISGCVLNDTAEYVQTFKTICVVGNSG